MLVTHGYDGPEKKGKQRELRDGRQAHLLQQERTFFSSAGVAATSGCLSASDMLGYKRWLFEVKVRLVFSWDIVEVGVGGRKLLADI